ncbi:hypothetical protein HXX76_005980 [Chlamydomonas incerta]|uniref:Glutamine amidotransferase type-2 domain-containing protein n=1 Tax=Chlamydomonas incerta TaxID=51695 RepID=A0A835W4T2_CHLIN|nr:hypothetical protein HXX76_005980 [Chlamydomonas incerta]|eukprot:KAG2437323.1 hypothetical protein HXX76_005980 [Chlamydomonas incerta]
MAALFICIVQQKVIEFNLADQQLHRAQKDEDLRAELGAIQPPADGSSSSIAREPLVQPGGGCLLLSPAPTTSVANVGSAVCVFEGILSNAAALAEAYAPVPEDEPSPAVINLSNAQLVCHMYAQAGVDLLGLLRGSFTFVLYESKTSRVLAARDGSGRCPLFQGRTGRDSLALSCSRQLLEGVAGCHDVVEFVPGDYKYGWSATPRRYQPADSAKLSRRSLDGHHGGAGGGSAAGSRRSSMDVQHGGAGGGSRPGSRRTSLDFHDPHMPATAAAAAAAAASVLPQHSHPHRTYVVTAEDPRIHKAQAGAAAPVPGQQSPQHHHGGQQQQHRPGSGRRTSMDRRRSMDQQGSWRLGSEQPPPPPQQPLAAQAHAKEAQHRPPPPQAQQAQAQAQQGAGGRRRSMSSRDGRPSLDGRSNASSSDGRSAVPKATQPQAQAQKPKEAGKSSAHEEHKDGAACSLRVEAPEWKPTWAASAGAHKQPATVEAVTAP